MRTCGDCSQCCRVLSIYVEELSPPGHWCNFCTQPGCSIYNTTIPSFCRNYFCGWLQNENIPEDLKPNRSGVVLETLDNNLNTSKFWIDEKNFTDTDVAVKKLEQYTTRKYTKIYNGE